MGHFIFIILPHALDYRIPLPTWIDIKSLYKAQTIVFQLWQADPSKQL